MKTILTLLFFFPYLLSIGQSTLGCTDELALNYMLGATEDDGSCCYSNYVTVTASQASTLVYNSQTDFQSVVVNLQGPTNICLDDGCYYFDIFNSSSEVMEVTISFTDMPSLEFVIEPGTFIYENIQIGEVVFGCMDWVACNYNPAATCQDYSCNYDCYGCTDPNAINYSPEFTIDDGDCCTDPLTWYTIEATGDVSVSVSSPGSSYYNSAQYPMDVGVCHPSSCLRFFIANYGSFAADVTITNPNGVVIYNGTVEPEVNQHFYYSQEEVVGCMEEYACNYNPDATCGSSNLCDYTCYGCTDPSAVNFDAIATVDDGSCCFPENYLSVLASGPGFISISNNNIFFNDYLSLQPGVINYYCLNDGCYILDFYLLDTTNVCTISITNFYGETLHSFETMQYHTTHELSINAIIGCDDPQACNYNLEVNCPDFNLCDYSCQGCTDENAQNFDPDATMDDGSCCLHQYTLTTSAPMYWLLGPQTSNGASQYGETETGSSIICFSDGCYSLYISPFYGGTGIYELRDENNEIISQDVLGFNDYSIVTFENNIIEGCYNPQACNYNPFTTCVNESLCDYSCHGCTDPQAENYFEDATYDNESCCYDTFYQVEFFGEGSWYAINPSDNTLIGYKTNTILQGFCSDDACFAFYGSSSNNLPINYIIYYPDGTVLMQGTSDEYGDVHEIFSNEDILGCTVPNACNYNPSASCGSLFLCDFSCLGCTDSAALNYDPNVSQDDGSCCYNSWYTLEFSQPTYWEIQHANSDVTIYGNYPNDSGFCLEEECFILRTYTSESEPLEFYVYNSNGDIISSGVTESYGFLYIPISTTNEYAGCTNPSACNYDPLATCDLENCEFICGGCTNPNAINYNADAQWDDNTCFFSIEPPEIELIVEDVEIQDVYYVRIDVIELGNGAPYAVSSNYNTDILMINNNGLHTAGPFECGSTVEFTIASANYGSMEYTVTDPVGGACTIISTEEIETEQTFGVYPNPSNGFITISGIENITYQAQILDMTGRDVFQQQINGQTAGVQLNIEALAKGYYTLQISNESSVMSRGIVKE